MHPVPYFCWWIFRPWLSPRLWISTQSCLFLTCVCMCVYLFIVCTCDAVSLTWYFCLLCKSFQRTMYVLHSIKSSFPWLKVSISHPPCLSSTGAVWDREGKESCAGSRQSQEVLTLTPIWIKKNTVTFSLLPFPPLPAFKMCDLCGVSSRVGLMPVSTMWKCWRAGDYPCTYIPDHYFDVILLSTYKWCL